MLQYARKPLLMTILLMVAILFAACGSETSEVLEEAANGADIAEPTPVVAPTEAATSTPEPTPDNIVATECAWDESMLVGYWEHERGFGYQFTESGTYFYSAPSVLTKSGSWACAEGPDTAIILSRIILTRSERKEFFVRFDLEFSGNDTLSIERAIEMPGRFREYTRVPE